MSDLNRPPTLWYSAVLQPKNSRFPDFAQHLVDEVSRLRPTTKGLTVSVLENEASAVAWLLEGVYQAYFSHPRSVFALPQSERFYLSSHPIPVPFPFGAIQRIVEAAQSLGWLKTHMGYRHPDGSSLITTMGAAGDLATLFCAEYFEWMGFEPPPDHNLILVADDSPAKVRRSVSLNESPDVAMWQRNLRRINELFLSRCIALDAANEVILASGMARLHTSNQKREQGAGPMSFAQVSLRRIFARGRLDRGGRFYGGWWQNLPGRYRKYISIDGEPTCEADYSGMALNCLYALEGKDIGDSDAYDIGILYNSRDDPGRKIVKKYINAVLNDEKGTYRLPNEDQRLLGISRLELKNRVKSRHAAVAHRFHTGVGLELQFRESKVAERVMLRLANRGEVCLPIHDSFIVRSQLIQELEQVMQEEYSFEFDRPIKVQAEVVSDHESSVLPDPSHIPPGLTEEEQTNALHAIHWGRVSIGNRYYTSWVMATTSEEELIALHEKNTETYRRLLPWLTEQTKGVTFP